VVGVSLEEEKRRILVSERDREAREKADRAAYELLAEEAMQKESGEPARGQVLESSSKKKKAAKPKKRKGDADVGRALDDTAHNDGDDTAATALPEAPPGSKVELQLSVGSGIPPRVEARTSATPVEEDGDESDPPAARLSRSSGAPAAGAKGGEAGRPSAAGGANGSGAGRPSAAGAGATAEDEWEVVTKAKRKGKKSASEPDDPQPSPSSDASRMAPPPRRANTTDLAARAAPRAKPPRPASAPLQEALDRPAGCAAEGSPAHASECDSKSEAGSSSASSATGTGTASDTTAACPGAGPAQHAFALWADATNPPGPRPSSARLSPETAPEPAEAPPAAARARGPPNVVLPTPPDWPALKTSSPSMGPAAPPSDRKPPAASDAPKLPTTSPAAAAAAVASAVSAAASAVSAISTAAAAASAAARAPGTEPPRPTSRSWASLVKKDLKAEEPEEENEGPAVAKGYTLLGGGASLSAPVSGAGTSSVASTAAAGTGGASAPVDAAATTPALQPAAGEAQACGCQADMPHTCSFSTQTSPPPSPTDAPHGFARPARSSAPRVKEAAVPEPVPPNRARTQHSGASSAPPTPISTKPKPPAWSSAAPRPRALMIPGSTSGIPATAASPVEVDAPARSTAARQERPFLPDSRGSNAVSYSKAAGGGTVNGSPSPRPAADQPPLGMGGAHMLPPPMPSYSQAAGRSSGGEATRANAAATPLLEGLEQPTGHTQLAAEGGAERAPARPSSRGGNGREGGNESSKDYSKDSSREGGTGGKESGRESGGSGGGSVSAGPRRRQPIPPPPLGASVSGSPAEAAAPLPATAPPRTSAAAAVAPPTHGAMPFIPISPMQAAMNRLHSQLNAHTQLAQGPGAMLPMRPLVRVPTGAHPYAVAGGAHAGAPMLWMQPHPVGIFFGVPVMAGGGQPELAPMNSEDAGMSEDERAAFSQWAAANTDGGRVAQWVGNTEGGQWAVNADGADIEGGAGPLGAAGPGGGHFVRTPLKNTEGVDSQWAANTAGGHLVHTPLLQPGGESSPRPDGRAKAGRGGKRAELPGFARSQSVGSRPMEPPPSPGQPLPMSVPSSPIGPAPDQFVPQRPAVPSRMLPPAQSQAAPPPQTKPPKKPPTRLSPNPSSPGGPPPSPTTVPAPPPPPPRLSKLHDEIFAFAQASILSGEAAHAEVMSLLASLRAVVSARWAQATVELYGSRSTGLSLASSDVDVTLLGVPTGPGRNAISSALRDLHSDLSSEPWVTSQTLVLSARIPVLKIKSATGVPVDVTISDSAQHTGLLARDLVLNYLHQAPQLTPLVIVLKSFLRELGLNDPYTGGMSSYSLVVLLWLFVCESAHRGFATTDLGYQLLGFFSMFLYRFESQLTHVDDPLSPMISGPGEVRENIMHSCYQIGRVCRTFHRALQLLAVDQPAWSDEETPLLPRLFSDVAGFSRATQTEPAAAAAAHRHSADAACNTPARLIPGGAAASGPPASPCSAVVASVVEAMTMQLEASARAAPACRPFTHKVSPTVVAAAAAATALASPSRVPAPMTFATMASQTHGGATGMHGAGAQGAAMQGAGVQAQRAGAQGTAMQGAHGAPAQGAQRAGAQDGMQSPEVLALGVRGGAQAQGGALAPGAAIAPRGAQAHGLQGLRAQGESTAAGAALAPQGARAQSASAPGSDVPPFSAVTVTPSLRRISFAEEAATKQPPPPAAPAPEARTSASAASAAPPPAVPPPAAPSLAAAPVSPATPPLANATNPASAAAPAAAAGIMSAAAPAAAAAAVPHADRARESASPRQRGIRRETIRPGSASVLARSGSATALAGAGHASLLGGAPNASKLGGGASNPSGLGGASNASVLGGAANAMTGGGNASLLGGAGPPAAEPRREEERAANARS
jgi:hypothetical protein